MAISELLASQLNPISVLSNVTADVAAAPIIYAIVGTWKRIWASSKPQVVVHRNAQLLVCTQISFCRLNGSMAEQKLNLLQVATTLAAELGAGAALMPHAALPELCRMSDHAE